LKLPWIDPDRIIKMLEKASRHRLKPHRRSLARDQALSIHLEFVALCLSTKDGVVFEHKTRSLCARSFGARSFRVHCPLVEKRRRQTADAPAHNHAVKGFTGVLDCGRRSIEGMIANHVAVGHHLVRVAVRAGIVADTRSAVPVLSRHELERACGRDQRGSGSQQRSVQKVAASDPLRLRHPGTHTLYNTNLHVKDGGGTFRARFGVERDEPRPGGGTVKVNLLAEGSYALGSDIRDGYPEFTYGVLKKLGWDKDLTDAEKTVIERIGGAAPDAVSWAIDLSGGIQRVALEHGCIPFGNGKARANAWTLPDPIPVHREPIYTPRPDLVGRYPTLPDARQFRVPNVGFTVQKAAVEKGIAKQFPIILSSGRLVEFEGGGEETRSNKWLAELQQDMFVEINPADAAERGIKDGGWALVWGPEMASGKVTRVKALVTERVGRGVAWMPFHFAGRFQNVDQRAKYPPGCDPIVIGESVNTITTYGFDPVTGMQEPKATLCQIRAG